jgi:uncharacterized membrane protein YdbT with pleckstrin-like domain
MEGKNKNPDQTPNSPVPEPVAYTKDGQPLYAAPQKPSGPQFVHLSRAIEPANMSISPEVKKRHDESTRKYPFLNLSKAEYVIRAVRRHPIGMLPAVFVTVLLVAITAAAMINYSMIMEYFGILNPPGFDAVLLLGTLLIFLFLVGGYIAVWVYLNNKFFLTNESVIQEIQTSLFHRFEQTVSLANIEDASFRQEGILQTLLNYGSIRLSTQGDETTYRFTYVANPKDHIAVLNDAVEAFKNGRPFGEK